ncbi:golgi uridine diphosphate-N- acetylglucosamine transporter [Coemansia sp. 'formosensis']|nr:golgi uridine diphosphate-N- acetylglucosamine transporter [Coemansia sp. 'formosensis']
MHLTRKAKTAAMVVASDWVTVLGFIFGGCCSNVFALENLVRDVPKCGNLITFAQFFFITIVGLPEHIHWPVGAWLPRLRERQVPLRRWMVMVGLYFCVSILNNLALGFQISIPLHIIFRSSGLIANMVCGYFVAAKRYPARQVVAVLMVSVGVVIATLASITKDDGRAASAGGALWCGVPESVVGIALLTLGVGLAALLGLYQEATYRIYGKHWREGLFYNHALALPMFVLFRGDIASQARALSLSRPVALDGLPLVGACLGSCVRLGSVPALWVSLAGNVASQLVCVSGVHRMTSMSSSLSLNVVLNLRKLVSLVLSVLLFKNPVTRGMLVGCALVFMGTFAYAQTGSSSAQVGVAKRTVHGHPSSRRTMPLCTTTSQCTQRRVSRRRDST